MNNSLENNMRALKAGERRVLADIYDETKHAVFSVAYGILRSREDAADVMQETYMKIAEKIGSYRGGESPKSWICMIARNCALDEYRKKKRLAPLDAANDVATNEQPLEDVVAAKDVLETARRVLSASEYSVVYMHTVGNLSHREIASVIGKPPATVRWTYANAINKLKKILNG